MVPTRDYETRSDSTRRWHSMAPMTASPCTVVACCMLMTETVADFKNYRFQHFYICLQDEDEEDVEVLEHVSGVITSVLKHSGTRA